LRHCGPGQVLRHRGGIWQGRCLHRQQDVDPALQPLLQCRRSGQGRTSPFPDQQRILSGQRGAGTVLPAPHRAGHHRGGRCQVQS
ncbi:hypothetical protein LTR53_020495, partial [Teratosphaeriaceae sp. CCFEE 6253]